MSRLLTSLLLALTMALVPSWQAAARAERLAITFATDWKAQAEHGGFYQALAKGFYAARGLDVTIRPGGPQQDNPRLIAAGALDLAMASNGFQPMTLLAAGAEVTVVMAAFQKDPQVLMTHPGDAVASLKDLAGRPVFIGDSAVATFWPWLKARFGFTDDQIRKYAYSLAPWLTNPGTVQEGYLTSEPFTAEQAGVVPNVYLFADAGYQGYAAMVMVTNRFLAAHEDAVAAFVAASIQGWADYMTGDPAPANALIKAHTAEMTDALLAFSRRRMGEVGLVSSGDVARLGIGAMTEQRWRAFYDEMSALGVLPRGLDVTDVFTTRFLTGVGASAPGEGTASR